jgi:hypothetical protein
MYDKQQDRALTKILIFVVCMMKMNLLETENHIGNFLSGEVG